jgi:acyl-coenzyme A thioesterase PaaI-like protein
MAVDPGRSLADELRAVIELAATVEHDPAALARAGELVGRARELLDGPARKRWYEVDEPADVGAITRSYAALSPFRGSDNPLAPPLRIERVDDGDGPLVEGRVRLGRAYEGPPHGVHGGVLAGLFDDILGAAQRLSGSRGVTGRLTIRYRSLTPVGTDLVLRAGAGEPHGKRVVCTATCHAGDTLTAEAEALFVAVDFDRLADRG